MKTLLMILAGVVAFGWGAARAQDLVVQLPDGAKVSSSVARNPKLKESTAGRVDRDKIHFAKLAPGINYDLTITLADGHVLQGVNMGWYNEEKVDAKTHPMSADDRVQIGQLVTPGKDFFNKIDLMLLTGDHDRATGLVRQIRDKSFHSDKGGEVISRWELWYFRFEAGGWEKVQQGQQVLRRDRFESQAAYEKAMSPIQWVPDLGGIVMNKGETKIVTLTWPSAGMAATAPQPTSQPMPSDQMP